MDLQEIKRQSNKGFTLLEVLLAIVLLSIVVVPFLHVFVSASMVNMKARQTLRATTVAQNAMEEIKAENIGNLTRYVNGAEVDEEGRPISASGVSLITGFDEFAAFEAVTTDQVSFVQPEVSGIRERTDHSGTVLATEYIGQKDALGNDAEDGYFVFPDVKLETAEYDLLFHYRKAKEIDNAGIRSMSDPHAAYFAEMSVGTQEGEEGMIRSVTSNSAITAAKTFASRNLSYRNTQAALGLTAPELQEAGFQSIMSKTVTISIAKNSASGTTSVDVEYVYDCGSGYTDPETDDRYYTEHSSIYNNYSSGETLEAVYIYYFPLYSPAMEARDHFVINNSSDTPVDVYLICMDSDNFTAYEHDTYRAALTLTEENGSGDGFLTKVMSNQCKAGIWQITDNKSEADLEIEEMGNFSKETAMYDVEIKVYKHKAGAFAKTNGFSVFTPESGDLVTTYTGSLLDNTNKAD